MNFTQLILTLYRAGEITFDDDGTYNLSPFAIVDIQRHIAPMSIFNFDLDDTLPGQMIRKDWESKRYQEANEERMFLTIDLSKPDQLKSAICAHIHQLYGVA